MSEKDQDDNKDNHFLGYYCDDFIFTEEMYLIEQGDIKALEKYRKEEDEEWDLRYGKWI